MRERSMERDGGLALLIFLVVTMGCDPTPERETTLGLGESSTYEPLQPTLFLAPTETQRTALAEGILAFEAGERTSALRWLRQVATEGPWSEERLHASLWLAQELEKDGHHREAMEIRERAAHDGPASPDAWLDLGRSALHAQQSLEAIAALRAAVQLDPGRLEASWILESVLRDRGLDADALEVRLARERWLHRERLYLAEEAQEARAAQRIRDLDQGVRDPNVARTLLAAFESRHPEVQTAAQEAMRRNAPPGFAPILRKRAERLERGALRDAWLDVAAALESQVR